MSLKRFRTPNSNSTQTDPNPPSDSSSGAGGGKGARILYEAVVVNFFSNPEFDLLESPINDPDKTYSESMQTGVNRVKNPGIIGKMPRCSIAALVVSDREAWSGAQPEIFYPLFPHMTMPVKPGEKIWVIYDTMSRNEPRRGYWLGRISSNIAIDDPNYTHLDREFLYSKVPTQGTSAIDAHEGASDFEETDVYSFMAGAGDASKNTMPGEDPYNTIVSTSLSYVQQFNGESVPRFSPRVGDFIIEGSNNTLISLGQDRPSLIGPADESGIKGIGTIDIVVGRGQGAETAPAGDPIELEKRGQSLTGYSETNKYPQFQGDEPNELEGNPDFATDLSRVYVSMKTDGDSNFGLSFPNYESITGQVDPVPSSPYVILKSTNNRIISKEDGTIRIIKEGTADSSRAVIVMEPNGTIMVDGPKIVIGSGIESINGQGNQVFIGRGATESIVLGDQLNSILIDLLNSFLTAAPSFVATGTGPGVLNPDVIAAITTLITELSVTKSNLSKIGKTR